MKEMGKGCKPCTTSVLSEHFPMRLTPPFSYVSYL